MARPKSKIDTKNVTMGQSDLAAALEQAGLKAEAPTAPSTSKEKAPSHGPALKFHEMIKSRNFVAKLRMEKGGRGGKIVTVIDGLPKNEAFLNDLLKTLKTKCGAGGTYKMDAKDGVLELQGEHRERVYHFLKEYEFQVKGWPA